MKSENSFINTPVGLLKIKINNDKLISINYVKKANENINNKKSDFMKRVINQLEQYFKKERKVFDIQLEIKGTQFQKDVYKTLKNINYGETVSYKKLAELSGHKNAQRAVGTVLKNNKIPIIIPCHRVIKSDGSLGKYNGGVDKKKRLLMLEGFLTKKR